MKKQILVLLLLISICNIYFVYSQNKTGIFRDSIDNAIDLSNFLMKHKGVLPVVIPVTDPAVGYGAVVGGLYFVPKSNPKEKPDIVAVGGGLTSNGTWMVAGGYNGFWKNDRIRYRGIVAYGDIFLDYYIQGSKPVGFNMKAFAFLQQANFRLGKSDFFIGGKYLLSQITIPLFDGNDFIDPLDLDMVNSGISLITEFDNLNNFFSPTKGARIHLSYDQNLEALGSTKTWGKLNFFTHLYFPVNETWIPALRVESKLATGDTPFYARPFVSLRGVPMLRYQGDLTILAETEQLFNISPRWGIQGFTGIGTAFDSLESMKSDDLVWNAGGGFRYLIAKALGLKLGADIARGPEEWAFYVVIGTAWLK